MALHYTTPVAFLKKLSNFMLNQCARHSFVKATSRMCTKQCPMLKLCSACSIQQNRRMAHTAADCDRWSSHFISSIVPERKFNSTSWFQRKRKTWNYEIVGLGEVSEPRLVLEHIRKPDYASSGVTEENGSDIEIKTEIQIKCMRESCAIARTILDEVAKYVKVGVTTDELDSIVHLACVSFGSYPSPLNYRGFPKSVCTSVNNVACHGIPDDRQLKDGDIVSIDVSIYHNGYHGDCAATYGVGSVDKRGRTLMNVALQCLNEGIKVCRPGQPFCQIGQAVSDFAGSHGFTVVPAFCGHGIGSYFHGPPNICHIPNDDKRLMEEGMMFTIEPVISEGGPDIVVLEDGWTAVTEDSSRCAQYEHTVLITKSGCEVLTLSKDQN